MNAVSNAPLPGLAPTPPLSATVAVSRPEFRSRLHKLKDTLITIYAYGVLGFGLLFPFVLAAWYGIFAPAGQ